MVQVLKGLKQGQSPIWAQDQVSETLGVQSKVSKWGKGPKGLTQTNQGVQTAEHRTLGLQQIKTDQKLTQAFRILKEYIGSENSPDTAKGFWV